MRIPPRLLLPDGRIRVELPIGVTAEYRKAQP